MVAAWCILFLVLKLAVFGREDDTHEMDSKPAQTLLGHGHGGSASFEDKAWVKVFESRNCKKITDVGTPKTDSGFTKGSMFRYDINGKPYAYYKRITAIRGSVSIRSLMIGTWSVRKGNKFNKDFKLYSSEDDAKANRHAWKACNGDHRGVGFPRDCGPNRLVGWKWAASNSRRSCGASRTVAFYVMKRPRGGRGTSKKKNGCTGKVQVYQHGSFTGWRASFPKGSYRHRAFVARGARNDDASSIIVPQGCKAIVYQHGGFTGWKAVYPPGKYPYRKFIAKGARNDDASSIKVVDAGAGGRQGSRVVGTWRNVRLRGKNGVPNRTYNFKEMRYNGNNGGDYTGVSIRGCAKLGSGWKPVCDHRNYCRRDNRSIYLGQTHHLAYGGHWRNNYMPRGLLRMKNVFRRHHMCFFTARHGGNHHDLCAWGNSHACKRPTQARHYMCAKASAADGHAREVLSVPVCTGSRRHRYTVATVVVSLQGGGCVPGMPMELFVMHTLPGQLCILVVTGQWCGTFDLRKEPRVLTPSKPQPWVQRMGNSQQAGGSAPGTRMVHAGTASLRGWLCIVVTTGSWIGLSAHPKELEAPGPSRPLLYTAALEVSQLDGAWQHGKSTVVSETVAPHGCTSMPGTTG